MISETKQNPAYDREQLVELLRNGLVAVMFTKKDGTPRTMNCTLDFDHIPADKIPAGSGTMKSLDVLPVFDVDAQDWRSFRLDSINEVVVLL